MFCLTVRVELMERPARKTGARDTDKIFNYWRESSFAILVVVNGLSNLMLSICLCMFFVQFVGIYLRLVQ